MSHTQNNPTSETTLQTYIATKRNYLRTIDRGANREYNEKAFTSRRNFFKAYCQKLGVHCPSLRLLSPKDKEGILVAFAIDVASGVNIKKLTYIKHTTIREYLKAAASFATEKGLPDPRYRYNRFGVRHGSTMFPELNQWNNFLAKWDSAPNKAWSLDMNIITSLEKIYRNTDNLSVEASTVDAIILGSHTGSRCAEYAKGTLRPGEEFSTLPNNFWLREWAGLPIALIKSDFTFMNNSRVIIPYTQAKETAAYVTVRFRFDKAGGQNFNSRTFRSIRDHPFLCPVQTSIRILNRWHRLGAPMRYPVCCFQPEETKRNNKKRMVISDKNVTYILRQAVIDAYKDPSHICRKNISNFRTHSIRVFACCTLIAAGLSDAQVEYKLRWCSSAWKTYIRESPREIDSTAVKWFQSALADITTSTIN